MTITYVDRTAGYPSQLTRPRYSERVWQVCKETFAPQPYILDELKKYSRSPQKLEVLYEMISAYDRKPTPAPKNDKLLDICFAQATKAFDITDNGKERLPMRHINDLQPGMFTLNTNPGMPYAQWGYTKKSDVFQMAKTRTRYLCHRIKEGQPTHLPPTMIFARNSVTEKQKRKIRGVWGKPLDLLIAEASIYMPWIEQMNLKKCTPNGYKYTMYHRGYRKLWDDITSAAPPGKCTYIMLDFRKYDTSLMPWLLRRARQIVDSQIDFDRYEHWGHPTISRSLRLARRLFKATIDTEFIMPDGYVWSKDVGTDSGSLMFQRDEDICTYVIGRYLMASMGYKLLFISVLGDDLIMAIEGQHNIDLNFAKSLLLKVFGVELNDEKSYSTLNILKASFLGRNLSYGYPKRDTVDMVFAALYPRQTDKTDLDVAQRVIALIYENAYVNYHAHRFLMKIWESLPLDIRLYCQGKGFKWDRKWEKIFRSYGLKQAPRCSPPTFDFIFWLMESPPNHFAYHYDGYGQFM